ncbi:unnamed protein product, partial [Ixodes hexagonus]
FLLQRHASRYKNYWKEQNVPHEKFSLFFGSTFQLIFKTFQDVENALYKKHGRLFGTFEDGKPVLYVAEPELLKHIFVKDFALTQRASVRFDDPYLDNMMTVVPPKEWKKIRTATSPAFTSGKLRKMHDLIESSAHDLSHQLKTAAENELDVDMKRFYGHFTLDVTARCAFGTKLGNNTQDTSDFVSSAKNAFFASITFPVAIQVFFQRFMKTLRKNIFNMDAFEFYKQVTMNIIQKRKEEKQVHNDFLQMMLNAQDEATSALPETTESRDQNIFDIDSDGQTKKPTAIKNLTEEEALAQCVLFFLAGQDTASTLASFASYVLAINPEVQEKLRKEVDDCFEKHGDSPNYDAISKLSYLNGVVSETLRMFPPAPRLERSPMEDYVLGDTGIKVPKDCIIVVPLHSMHHDPEFFPDPYTFKPERFINENASSIRPYTYLPFGAGPRNCIGMRFALQTVKTCLLHSVRNVEFVRTPKTKVHYLTLMPVGKRRTRPPLGALTLTPLPFCFCFLFWLSLLLFLLFAASFFASLRGQRWRFPKGDVSGVSQGILFGGSQFVYIKYCGRSGVSWTHRFVETSPRTVFEDGRPTLYVAEPDLLKYVFVKDFSSLIDRRVMSFKNKLIQSMIIFAPLDNWRRLRGTTSPAFTTGKLRKVNAISTQVVLLMYFLDPKTVNSKEFIDYVFFARLSVSLTQYTIKGLHRSILAYSVHSKYALCPLISSPSFLRTSSLSIIFIDRLEISNLPFFRSQRELTALIFPADDVAAHVEVLADDHSSQWHNRRHHDFLQLMMDAQKSALLDGNDAGDAENDLYSMGEDEKLDMSTQGKTLTEIEAMAQCVIFLLAGQDTTSSVIAYTVYLLALHPDVQEKLRQEVDDCFEQYGPEPALDVVIKLKYLDCVISESLRLYPPAVRLERSPVADYVMTDTGIKLPENCVIAIPVYAMHHDPSNFEEPYKFDPERFSEKNRGSIRPYSYLPFGAGPRNCVGMRFALQTVKLCLLHALHNVRFVRTSQTKVPLVFSRNFGLLTAKEIIVGVRQR